MGRKHLRKHLNVRHYLLLELLDYCVIKLRFCTLRLKSQYLRDKCWLEKERGCTLGRRWIDQCPRFCSVIKSVPKNLLSDKVLKGNNFSQSLRLSQIVHSFPLNANLLSSCDLPLDAILFIQFAGRIAEGKAGERCSLSLNYLFFIPASFRKRINKLEQALCDLI